MTTIASWRSMQASHRSTDKIHPAYRLVERFSRDAMQIPRVEAVTGAADFPRSPTNLRHLILVTWSAPPRSAASIWSSLPALAIEVLDVSG